MKNTSQKLKLGPDRAVQPFRSLPLNLAKRVSLFLKQFNVDGLEGLIELMRAYPLRYLSVFVYLKHSQAADQLIQSLQEETNTRLDVTLGHIRGELDWALADIFFDARAVEALSIAVSPCSLKDIRRLVYRLRSSKQPAHFVRVALESDILQNETNSLEAAACVADMISQGGSLMSLDLRHSNFNFSGKSLCSCRLLQALQHTKSLFYLRLRNAGLDAEGAALLGQVMQTQNTIGFLDVGENPIGDAGVIALAQSLETNAKLHTLYFGTVGATAAGGHALADSLRRNDRLQMLMMKDEDLGPQCGKAFATMLSVNTSLACLSLEYCDLGSEGCRYFVDALELNRTLKVLQLNYNGATLQDTEDLTEAGERNGVIEAIEVSDENLLRNKDGRTSASAAARAFRYHASGNSYAWHLQYGSLGTKFR